MGLLTVQHQHLQLRISSLYERIGILMNEKRLKVIVPNPRLELSDRL